MEPLLFLAHRIPFPPNKGDKIRSFHLLRHLSKHFSVNLGTFIDDEEDTVHIDTLDKMCDSTCFVHISPGINKFRALKGLTSQKPLSIEYYSSSQLKLWVKSILEEKKIRKIFLFSSPMAQYVMGIPGKRVIMDFIDIDSKKWKYYADESYGVMKWLYAREFRLLSEYESYVASSVDASLFVSKNEANSFKQCSGLENVHTIPNGVDTDYFNPGRNYPNPYPSDKKVIVFTGTMNYRINVSAVVWFAEKIMPKLITVDKSIVFFIVGAKPDRKVTSLKTLGNIEVTGSVDDIRPYLMHANLVVAPMQVASGFKNKIIEAMSMKKGVVSTSHGISGLGFENSNLLNPSDTIEQQTDTILELLKSNEPLVFNNKSRVFVLENYAWDKILAPLTELFE